MNIFRVREGGLHHSFGLWPEIASAALYCHQSLFWECMSIHNRFSAVIVKVSVAISQTAFGLRLLPYLC